MVEMREVATLAVRPGVGRWVPRRVAKTVVWAAGPVAVRLVQQATNPVVVMAVAAAVVVTAVAEWLAPRMIDQQVENLGGCLEEAVAGWAVRTAATARAAAKPW